MKKELIEEIKRIHSLTYGDNILTEDLLSQILNLFSGKKDDSKKADLVKDDVSDFLNSLENITKTGELSKQSGKDLKYQKSVETVQIALELLGYHLPIHGVDGLFGPETERAVSKFNKENLNMDSNVVSGETAKKMIDLLKIKNIKSKDIKNYVSSLQPYKNKYGDGKISLRGSELLNDPDFTSKLQEVSNNLGIEKEWLIKIMMKESRMDPYITNNIGCVGLIQFCPDKKRGNFKKIGKYNVNLSELKTLSPLVQLDLIEEYYKPYKENLNSIDDLYLATFYPAALGKPNSHVIGGKTSYGLKVSKQNPAIARSAGKTPGQDFLTVGDVKRFVA